MTTIDLETFYMGFLLGLVIVKRPSFQADGDEFHEAFRRAIEVARRNAEVVVRGMEWMGPNGHRMMLHAEQMIAFGLSARLLTLASPDLIHAKVRWSGEQAEEELKLLGHRDWFVLVAREFSQECPKTT